MYHGTFPPNARLEVPAPAGSNDLWVTEKAMATSATATARTPPPVRPLSERARDTAIVTGGVGGFCGACAATLRFTSAFWGLAVVGSSSAALGASFIGLRHVIVNGDFRQDSEVVSGIAMGTLAALAAIATSGRKVAAVTGSVWFVGGCISHYAHRHWLHYRLTRGI